MALATGCVVDEQTVLDTSAPLQRVAADTSDTCQPEWRVWLDATPAVPGRTVLGSLRAEGSIDLTRIVSAELVGGAEVLAVDPRLPTEAVLTIEVLDAAKSALVVVMDDGRRLVIDGAFGGSVTGGC